MLKLLIFWTFETTKLINYLLQSNAFLDFDIFSNSSKLVATTFAWLQYQMPIMRICHELSFDPFQIMRQAIKKFFPYYHHP